VHGYFSPTPGDKSSQSVLELLCLIASITSERAFDAFSTWRSVIAQLGEHSSLTSVTAIRTLRLEARRSVSCPRALEWFERESVSVLRPRTVSSLLWGLSPFRVLLAGAAERDYFCPPGWYWDTNNICALFGFYWWNSCPWAASWSKCICLSYKGVKCTLCWIKSIAKGWFRKKMFWACLEALWWPSKGAKKRSPPPTPALVLKLAASFGVVPSAAAPPVPQQYLGRQQPPQI